MMAKFARYIREERRRLRSERDEEVTSAYGESAHSGCGAKASYPSRRDAEVGAACAERRFNMGLRSYKCPYCGQWHLTSHI